MRIAAFRILVVSLFWSFALPGDGMGQSPVPAGINLAPNPQFAQGDDRPAAWKLAQGNGHWRNRQSLEIAGSGKDAEYWQSEPVTFTPGTIYRFSMQARRTGDGGGSIIAGPAFANRDYADVTDRLQTRSHCFWVPTKPAENYLRLGLWEGNGVARFEDVRVVPAMPVHRAVGRFVLGEGESFQKNRYIFRATFGGEGSNYHRPLLGATAAFNSDRWCFGGDGHVSYRFSLPGVTFRSAEVGFNVNYHIRGGCIVEAGRDGKSWRRLAAQNGLGAGLGKLPADLLPAQEIYLRLRPATSDGVFQVNEISFEADTLGDVPDAFGETIFAEVREQSPALPIDSVTLGSDTVGGRTVVRVAVKNPGAVEQVVDGGGQVQCASSDGLHRLGVERLANVRKPIQPGATATFDMPMPPAFPGSHDATIQLSAGNGAKASLGLVLRVPEFYRSDYGRQLTLDASSRGSAAVWWCDAAWKVARRRPLPAGKSNAAMLSAARNDCEAVQIVVRPTAPLRQLTANVGPLVRETGGASISADHIQVFRVHYHYVQRPTDGTGTRDWWPDALPPLTKPIDVAAGENQPLWVLVSVPDSAAPGDYAGTISLTAQGWSARVPIRLHVWNFALPERNHLETAFGFSPDTVFQYHNAATPADRRKILDLYFRSFAAHRISPYDPTPLDPIRVDFKPRATPPSAQIDFSAFDVAMTDAVRKYHFTGFSLPMHGMGGGTFHSRVEPSLAGFGENTPEYRAMFADYAKQVQDHLRQKGWLSMAYVYWFDEPEPKDYAFVRAGMARIKQYAPGIQRMLTEEPGDAALTGSVDIWCPISNAYQQESAEKCRARGERFWWYVCCGPRAPYCTLFIDHPATELRVWLWQTWQRKIVGNLVWASNWWTSPTAFPDSTQNPYEDPMSYTDGYGLPRGTKAYWGNGDGRFLYPPESAATPGRNGGRPIFDPPVSSIRWEMLREGIEDYEYLYRLRELLAERAAAKQRPPLDPAARTRIEALLQVPDSITRDATTFTTDPGPIYARRDAIARAIEELSR